MDAKQITWRKKSRHIDNKIVKGLFSTSFVCVWVHIVVILKKKKEKEGDKISFYQS